MTALRPSSLRLAVALSLTLAIGGLSGRGQARGQATKPVTPPPAKEKAKKAEKAAKEEKGEPVDLNSATTEELMTLPGIGESYARKIVDARPHKTISDLEALGVPAKRVEEIKPLAVVRPLPTAIDLNTASLATVETLPGVGPTLAKEVIAARPLAGYDDLAKIKGFGAAKVDALKGRVKFGRAETAKAKAEAKEAKAETKAKVEFKEARAETKEVGRPGAKVNLNTASLEELDALPGIGQVRAQAIVAARPFAKIEDIMKVKGIKEVEFGKVKDMITVGK